LEKTEFLPTGQIFSKMLATGVASFVVSQLATMERLVPMVADWRQPVGGG